MPIQARRPKTIQPPTHQVRRATNTKLSAEAIDELDQLEREAEVIEKGGASVQNTKSSSRRADPIPTQPIPMTPATPGATPNPTQDPNQPATQTNQPAGDCVSQLVAQGYSQEEAQVVCQQFDAGNIAVALWQRDDSNGLKMPPIMNSTRVRASRENSPERFDALLGWVKRQYPEFSREAQIELAKGALTAGSPISIDTTTFKFTKEDTAKKFVTDQKKGNKTYKIVLGQDGLFWAVTPGYAEELAAQGLQIVGAHQSAKKIEGVVLRRSDFWGDLAGTLVDMVQQANLPPTAQYIVNQVLDAVQRAQVSLPEPPIVAPVTVYVEPPQPEMMPPEPTMPGMETSFLY